MRTPFRIAILLALLWSSPAAHAWPGGGTLNLVSDGTNNKLKVTISIPADYVSGNQTTTVSGTMYVLADIDPATGATTALTILGGNIVMTDMTIPLKAFGFVSVGTIYTAGMAGTVYTPLPVPAPATATSSGGTFDASLHHLVINHGTITGTITATTPATQVNANFADSPVDGAGTGTGTVTVVPGSSSATYRTCLATMILPVDFTTNQTLNGTAVTVRVQGTVKTTGNLLIPLNSTVAGTSTWNNPAGGTWATYGNWLAYNIGNGTNVDFSTLDLTSDATVTLDGARTVRNMVFGDTTASNNWTINSGSGGTLTLDNGGTQPVIAVNNSTTTIGAVLAGVNGFAKAGPGTLILNNANTYTGATTVSGGTLNIGGGTASGSISATPPTVAAGATLAYNFSTPYAAPPLAVAGNLSYTSAAQLGLSGSYGGNQISAVGANVSVDGNLGVSAGNATITGASATAAGITSGGPRNITSTGNVTLTGTTGTGQYIDGISLAGVFTATAGTLTFDGTAAAGGAYGIECGVSGAWSGAISTFGNVAFKGTGGGGGTGGHDSDLNLGNLSGNGSVMLVGRGRGLRTNSTFTATGGLPYHITIQAAAGGINGLLGTGTDTTGNGNYTINSAANVVLDGRTINAGTGTISLTSATGYSVAAYCTLQSANLTMGDSNPITINSGAIFTLNTTAAIANVITGPGRMSITGGALTLAGANASSGGTTISAGKLTVSGSLAAGSPLLVASGGTLAGTGTIACAVSGSGTLAPGASGPGNLTINNSLTLAVGSTIAWQISDWTGAAGAGYDKLTVSSLSITANAGNPVKIQLSEQALAHFTETTGTFTLIQSAGAITGFDPAKFSVNASGFTSGHGTWAVQQAGNNLVLAYTRPNPDANGNGILDTWETASFGNASPGSNAPGDDADHDGISNLMEYALNTQPRQPNASPLVADLETVGADRYLRLTVPQNPAATNLTYTVEVSGDLVSWSSAQTLIEPNSPSNVLRVRDTVPYNSAPHRFMRLKVSVNP